MDLVDYFRLCLLYCLRLGLSFDLVFVYGFGVCLCCYWLFGGLMNRFVSLCLYNSVALAFIVSFGISCWLKLFAHA